MCAARGEKTIGGYVAASALAACLLASCGGDRDRAPAGSDSNSNSQGLTFHHVHLRAPDPAAEMERLARAHGCEKTIVPGVGVGVRCGNAYVLLERDDRPADVPPMRGIVTVTGRGSGARIRVRIDSSDASADRRALDAAAGAEPATVISFDRADPSSPTRDIAHLGFATADFPAAVAQLATAGARTIVTRDDSSLVLIGAGLPIELLRDAGTLRPGDEVDRRETLWCPMHPDVRARAAGRCPLCGMDLVPIPPLRLGEYALETRFAPAGPNRGQLTLRVLDPDRGEPARAFHTIHERLLHLFVISRDLTYFAHEHPVHQPDGRFVLDLAVPGPDLYLLAADVYPAGGGPQLLRAFWTTPDFRGRPFVPRTPPSLATAPQTRGAIRATLLTMPWTSGRRETITITLTDSRNGRPVTDLEPYLGAAGHLVTASADLADIVHSHPTDATATGPEVTFDATFPRPGRYKLWAQFQRAGTVETVAFVIEMK